MRQFVRTAALAFLAALAPLAAPDPAAAQGGARVGTLECDVAGRAGFIVGSSTSLTCTFRHVSNRPPERYRGTMTIVGLDVGATSGARMVWRVLAPTSDVGPGALAGRYTGASAQVTAGVGVGANALVGGFNRSFVLNPVSLGTQTGVNLAAGVSRLRLEAVEG